MMTGSDPARQAAKRRFFRDRVAVIGAAGIVLILIPALFAPFLANGRPLLLIDGDGRWTMPFLRFFFAPESSEVMVEKLFNFLSLVLPAALIFRLIFRGKKWCFAGALTVFVLLVSAAFLTVSPRMDKQDYREAASRARFALFAPIPYGPDEIAGEPCAAPDREHLLGCDDIGRDLAARIIAGSRVSLAVGILSTLLSLVIGLAVGMSAGFFRGPLLDLNHSILKMSHI